MTSRITSPTNFPPTSIAAGSGPGVSRQFELGNEDLISAIESKLGGHIPPGTTMSANYDKDATGAIKATLYQGEDSAKTPVLTFWRTFTVQVPGQGTYQFRKQIFTNVSLPLDQKFEKYQKSFELAAMACSTYSKICNDAILVKGGGVSKRNLNEESINILQKKSFVDTGLKLSQFEGRKIGDTKSIDVKIGDRTATIRFNEIKASTGTSMITRHKKFTIENPTTKYTKDLVKHMQKLFTNPEEIANQYMDPASDDAKALKDLHTHRKERLRGKGPKNPIDSARKVNKDAVRQAYSEFGADLKRAIAEISDQRSYISTNKPTLGWGIEWTRLGRQQRKLESMLREMQSRWPGISDTVQTKASAKVNQGKEADGVAPKAPDAAAQEKARKLEHYMHVAQGMKIDSSLRVKFAEQSILLEESKDKLKSMEKEHGVTQKHLEEVDKILRSPNLDPDLKASLEKEKQALESLEAAQNTVMTRLQYEMQAQDNNVGIIGINGRDEKFLKEGVLSADAERLTKESKELTGKAAGLPQSIPEQMKSDAAAAQEKSRLLRVKYEGLFLQHLFEGTDEKAALDLQIQDTNNAIAELEAVPADDPLKEAKKIKKEALENLKNQLDIKLKLKGEIESRAKHNLAKFQAAGFVDKVAAEQEFMDEIRVFIDNVKTSDDNIQKVNEAVAFHDVKIGKLARLRDRIAMIKGNIEALENLEQTDDVKKAVEDEKMYLEATKEIVNLQNAKHQKDSPERAAWHGRLKVAVEHSDRVKRARDLTVLPLLAGIEAVEEPPAPPAPEEPPNLFGDDDDIQVDDAAGENSDDVNTWESDEE